MEPIKVQIDVQVNFSDAVQNFIKGLFTNDAAEVPAPAKPKPVETPKLKPAEKPAETPEPKPAEKPAETPKPKPAETPEPKPVETSVGIEAVREALQKKVNAHRPEIKEKLTELGAPSVTKLDPSKYQELFDYLESLS